MRYILKALGSNIEDAHIVTWQATVERGFSINSELVVENLKESVVSQRIVFDAIAAEG